MVGWIRGFIRNYADQVMKMTEYLSKPRKWDWNVEIQAEYI